MLVLVSEFSMLKVTRQTMGEDFKYLLRPSALCGYDRCRDIIRPYHSAIT